MFDILDDDALSIHIDIAEGVLKTYSEIFMKQNALVRDMKRERSRRLENASEHEIVWNPERGLAAKCTCGGWSRPTDGCGTCTQRYFYLHAGWELPAYLETHLGGYYNEDNV